MAYCTLINIDLVELYSILNYNLYIYIFHKQNHLTRHCELLDYDEIAQLYQTRS